MERSDWKSMSIDELWHLHEEIAAELKDKIGTEKARLEERLRKIIGIDPSPKQKRKRPDSSTAD